MSTATRRKPKPTAERSQQMRELAARRHSLDTYIRSIVDRAPELTDQQKAKLAALLYGGAVER